ncbi:uncharacterized protein (DUF983 family) [Lewinella aquimaris]|uniref:Uncharacterized protein (DUF983 family) n=1 Tax=Neolewinella aquimaris TaxID=1835722 RepID=A0A840E7J9_9BACT|nr:DUF983 domain-containing protein [Neolewinella aquimaris]MBB4078038.1 uncharacterized protein (DUF983 family) [Neolewinella aquimaris]
MSSTLINIFALKCPTCHHGDLFPSGSFTFNRPFDQYKHCPSCGQTYFPEPGFYYGSMFISYIGSGFACLGIVMFLRWVLGWSMVASFGTLLAIVAVVFVWWFRFARSVWIHMIFKYKPEVAAAVAAGSLDVETPGTSNRT